MTDKTITPTLFEIKILWELLGNAIERYERGEAHPNTGKQFTRVDAVFDNPNAVDLPFPADAKTYRADNPLREERRVDDLGIGCRTYMAGDDTFSERARRQVDQQPFRRDGYLPEQKTYRADNPLRPERRGVDCGIRAREDYDETEDQVRREDDPV